MVIYYIDEMFLSVHLLMTEFDCPEVTLCGLQDIKIQLLLLLYIYIYIFAYDLSQVNPLSSQSTKPITSQT